MKYPHVLVIANNFISTTNSNGRTLGGLFTGWPKECIAEIGVVAQNPDFNICGKYYLITDGEIKNAFLKMKKAKGKVLSESDNISFVGGRGKRKRTSLTMLVRHFIWAGNRWYSDDLKKWIKEYNPEAILLQNSDATFIMRMGQVLARDYNIPLYMFNTEGFYFFKQDFISKAQLSNLFFPIFRAILRRQDRKTMRDVKFIFHGNGQLKEDYDNEFHIDSIVLYAGSKLATYRDVTSFKLHNPPTFAYIGNFEYKRPYALTEVAEVINQVCPESVLDVYGGLTAAQKGVLSQYDNIKLHGFVNYDSVIEAIGKSDVLFHVEVQNEYQEALKYGFSTKIADSVSSGKCFVIYSSPKIAGAKYIIETGAGWFVKTKHELQECIKTIITNADAREAVLQRANDVALENHQMDKVSKKFQEKLISLIETK